MNKYLAIDIGGTLIKYSVVNENYEFIENGEEKTLVANEDFLNQLKNIVEKYKKDVKGIAICMAGFINPETGENTDFSVRESFKIYNLKEELHKISGLPVSIENDSNCAAVGEMINGAAKEYKNFSLITIGTGIGGAIVNEGRLLRGNNFKAAESGFMIVGDNNRRAGATADLVRRVQKLVPEAQDGKYVFKHRDNKEIFPIYESWLEDIAVVVGNMAVLLDSQCILIGGGVSHDERFLEDLRKKVYDKFQHLEEYTSIRACENGNHAGRAGALYLLKKEYDI